MKVVILCGGQGTRAYPHTKTIPKALMTVDDLPIVEQVMRIYASFGLTDFVLSTGYLHEALVDYFHDRAGPWSVACINTGDDADTGDRILRLRATLDTPFHATYCDGLGDIEIDRLASFHRHHGGLATVTAAPLRSQYGLLYATDSGQVIGFDEKPVLPSYWINGGFFVFEPSVFEHWSGHNLERDVLPHLTALGELYLYRHTGFWRSMDTYKDQQELNQLWPPHADRLAVPPLGRKI